jgi:hypothetical protein
VRLRSEADQEALHVHWMHAKSFRVPVLLLELGQHVLSTRMYGITTLKYSDTVHNAITLAATCVVRVIFLRPGRSQSAARITQANHKYGQLQLPYKV